MSRFQRIFFSLKNVFLSCKMSKMHVNHSRVAVDLKKILQSGSAESKTAKLVEDIWSEYCVKLKARRVFGHFHKMLTSNMFRFLALCSKKKRLSVIWTFIPLASLKFLIPSLWVDFQDKGIYNKRVNGY